MLFTECPNLKVKKSPTFSPVIKEKKTKVGDFYVVTYRL